MNLTFRHFEIVDIVANARSISRAAGILGLTQSAVTHALQALEDQIGQKLFFRSPAGLEPTEAATIFLRRNAKIQTSLEGILNEIERIKRFETGMLTVVASIWPSTVSVEIAVARLSRQFPRLTIDIVHDGWRSATERILAGEIDLGVLELELASTRSELKTELLCSDPAYFFCRADHPVTRRVALTLHDIAQYPYVGTALSRRSTEIFSSIKGAFGTIDPETGLLKPHIMVRTFGSIKNIVFHSDAIGVCPPSVIADEIAAGRLVILKSGKLPDLRANYGFAWRKNQTLGPSALTFMDMVRTIEAERRSAVDN